MRVNQAGEECPIAEIDEFGALRALYVRADFDDPVALDQDFARRQILPIIDLEKTHGVQDNCMRCRHWRLGEQRQTEEDQDGWQWAHTIAIVTPLKQL